MAYRREFDTHRFIKRPFCILIAAENLLFTQKRRTFAVHFLNDPRLRRKLSDAAMCALGNMLDYAVHDCDCDGDYKQKQNDINRAQTSTLLALSRTLGCAMEDLMEPELAIEA